MRKPYVWKYAVGGLLIVALVAGGVYFGNSGTFKGSLRGSSTVANIGVGVTAPGNPGVNLNNVYVNMYKVKPVRANVYAGELISTKTTGSTGEASFAVPLGSIVDFVGFKKLANAQAAKTWTFIAPPYRNFLAADSIRNIICQIDYLNVDAKMVLSNGLHSCMRGSMSVPYSDNVAQDNDSDTTVVPTGEDCITIDPKTIQPKKGTGTSVTMVEGKDGNHWMKVFPNMTEYNKALEIIKAGGLTRECFVGRGGKDAPMGYWLNATKALPTGKLVEKEDCIGFDRANLKIKDGSKGSAFLMDGKFSMLYASSKAAIQARLDMINTYKADSMCYVGRPDPSMVYFKKDAEPVVVPAPKGDCIGVDYKKLSCKKDSNTSFTMTDGISLIDVFPSQQECNAAVGVATAGKFTYQCFVGRGQAGDVRKDEPMEYWLNGTNTLPTGKLVTKEDCISFDRANLKIKDGSKGPAFLMDGKFSMLYASTKAAIQARLDMINQYKANSMCYVGRPDPSMIYFKK